MNQKFVVDVVIPTFKPDKKLYHLLKRLNKQTYSVSTIFIINTDKQLFIEDSYKEFSNIVYNHIERDEFDHGGTRNLGLNQSNADIVLFMTQDAVPDDEFLIEELLKPFQNDKVAVTYARQLSYLNSNIIDDYTLKYNYPDYDIVKSKELFDELGIKTFFCSNVCAAYRKDRYLELGGFVQKTIFNEDMIYASKAIHAGYQIYYAANARVKHSHNYSYIQQFKRNFDLGVSQRQYADVFQGVKSEDEGIKLVKKTASYLFAKGKWYYILDLIMKSGFKFMGYRLGKRYERLPKCIIKKLTMNKGYWLG